MKVTPLKLLVASMTFVIGIALASAWVNYFTGLAQRLDEAVVNTGVDLLGKLSAGTAGVSPPASAYERGRAEAEGDIRAGKLRVKSLGLGSVAYPLYKEMLERNYGIEFIDYGCLVTDDLM